MREFIMYSRKGATSSDFNLKDLPGSGGRMDLNARCVISALWLSRDMRRDSRMVFSLNGPPEAPLAMAFDGKELERVTPDERNIGLWIKKVLDRKEEIGDEWKEVHDGIYLSKKSFQDLIKERSERNLYVLHESGEDIRSVDIKEDPVFVLGSFPIKFILYECYGVCAEIAFRAKRDLSATKSFNKFLFFFWKSYMIPQHKNRVLLYVYGPYIFTTFM